MSSQHSIYYSYLILAIINLSHYSVFGFPSQLRSNPSSPVEKLESLLASASMTNDDISSGNPSNQYRQLQHSMEHSMLSPATASQYRKKPPPIPAMHQGEYLPPHATILTENADRPVYDPGDDIIKHYNSDERDDYMDVGDGNAASIANMNNEFETNDKIGVLRKLEEEIRDEQEIVRKSALMMQLLEDPSIDTLPMVYVEDPQPTAALSPQIDSSLEMNNVIPGVNGGLEKRSRYYRRYPWKRHSSRNRGTYESDARYLCVPSKEDVFKLLVGLHENRNGNHHKQVNFCNRKRPAKTIFTNIRFLG